MESQRKKGQKPIGGQLNHRGETLKLSESPDKQEIHPVQHCEYCGYGLENETVAGYEERQVFDIPSIHIEVTAHQAEIKICPECSLKNKGEFPDHVTQPTQYGNGIKTWASYFSVQHFIPLARTSQIVEDLIGHRISEASVLNCCDELADCWGNPLWLPSLRNDQGHYCHRDRAITRNRPDVLFIALFGHRLTAEFLPVLSLI